MEIFSNPDTWIALLTLTTLEIVLGIDNIVFISILTGKLPEEQQPRARQIGLGLAMGMRILLLLAIGWVIGLTEPLFHIGELEFSGRSLILIGGGLFLLVKATFEIHEKLEGAHAEQDEKTAVAVFSRVITQIVLLDLVFSLDSVITAVGLADDVPVMIIAVVIAVGVMMVSAGAISDFVNEHPTVKMLALSFLLLIRLHADRRGLRGPHPEGLRVLRDGLRRVRRDAQPPDASPQQEARRAAAHVHQGARRRRRGRPPAVLELAADQIP